MGVHWLTSKTAADMYVISSHPPVPLPFLLTDSSLRQVPFLGFIITTTTTHWSQATPQIKWEILLSEALNSYSPPTTLRPWRGFRHNNQPWSVPGIQDRQTHTTCYVTEGVRTWRWLKRAEAANVEAECVGWFRRKPDWHTTVFWRYMLAQPSFGVMATTGILHKSKPWFCQMHFTIECMIDLCKWLWLKYILPRV